MSDILNYTPGQIITFYEEVKDINGQRTDDGYVPAITRVLLPRFVVAAGYPQAMTRIDVGLYYFQLTLPKGAPAIGTYFVDITYKDPNTLLLVNDSRQIVVTAPYGNYSATVPDGYGGDGYGIGYGVAGGDLFGHYPSPIVAGLQGKHISSAPPTSGQVLSWNGTAWAPTTFSSLPPDGYAFGDLAGTYPNPIVAKLRGHTVATADPSDGQVLTWDDSDGYWRPETPTPPTVCYAYVSAPIAGYADGYSDHITFDVNTTIGSTVSLDTSSAYSVSTGAASIGRFTLSGGHSYKLEGSLNAQFDGIIQYQWWDATNGIAIPGASVAGNAGGAAPLPAVAFIPASYISGPGILVELRLTYVQSNTYIGLGTSGGTVLPWAIIESIG